VVTPSGTPGAIIEPLFLSNDGDAAVAARAEGKHAIVTAYEHAIVDYFEQFPPQPR
jgi:N-acetylmuramoyl-L-alanine amidase